MIPLGSCSFGWAKMPLALTTITEPRDPSEGWFVAGGVDVHALAGAEATGQLDDTQVPASAAT